MHPSAHVFMARRGRRGANDNLSHKERKRKSAEEKRGREESGNLRKNESRGQRGAKKKKKGSVTRTKRKYVKIEGDNSKGKRRR